MHNKISVVWIPLGFALAFCFALFRPNYFSDPQWLGALIVLQLLAAIILTYRETLFAALVMVFLFAGMDVPAREIWTSVRWLVLGVGAITGLIMWLKSNSRSIRVFHVLALGCVLTGLVSALVSAYPEVALLKATSLSLLFLYSATGFRVAVIGHEENFFPAVLVGCEILVYVSAIAYFVMHVELFGNRNSLGVVTGVIAFPMLLWGLLISERRSVRRRRSVALLLCLVLLLSSYERAGIMAALVSSSLLCIGLRRYRFLFTGLAVALLTALLVMAFVPLPAADHSDDSSLTSRFVYKGKREAGVLASRRTVWEKTLSSLQEHPWFGTGFGTSATAYDKTRIAENFFSAGQVTREHGNSYLEIAEWVGLIGVVPFASLLLLVAVNVVRVCAWMRHADMQFSPAVPLAAFVAGALVHAGFEDWLFAVGYHTCVLFWAFAFLLSDFVPAKAATRVRYFDARFLSPPASNPLAAGSASSCTFS
jgi:O-antigen ligase